MNSDFSKPLKPEDVRVGRLFKDGAYGDEERYVLASAYEELKAKLIRTKMNSVFGPPDGDNTIDDAAALQWAVTRLVSELPQKRDWLDPDIEKVLKEAVKRWNTLDKI